MHIRTGRSIACLQVAPLHVASTEQLEDLSSSFKRKI